MLINLVIEHVVLEQHLLRAALEAAEIERGREQRHAALRHVGDRLGRQIEPPAGDRHEKPRDRRIARLAEAHDQVLDSAQPLTATVKDTNPDEQRQMQHRRDRDPLGHAQDARP